MYQFDKKKKSNLLTDDGQIFGSTTVWLNIFQNRQAYVSYLFIQLRKTGFTRDYPWSTWYQRTAVRILVAFVFF